MLLILLDKYIAGDCTVEEQAAIERWYGEYDEREDVLPGIDQLQAKYASMYSRVRAAVEPDTFKTKSIKKRRWLWYAAAAMLIFAIGSGVYYFNNQSSAIIGGTGVTAGDVAPGMNRAILTINNNQNIDLAANKTGININNTITYNDGEKIADAGQLLQLTTPRGGQYQAVLPDGSKVWLNAASSIKFPSKFGSKERRVEVTGEVYMEIAKSLTAPFRVTVGNTTVQVLGTSFNINAYPEEDAQKTTLVSGAVKVLANGQQVVLQPGEAAAVKEKIKVSNADVELATAWKNGLFQFKNASLTEMMTRLSRWYDIEVVYQQKPSPAPFTGKIPRNLPLSSVLKILELNMIHFKTDGNKIIVLP